jgi:hypothetical protein
LDVTAIDGVGEKIASQFKKAGVNTVEDLMKCNPFVVNTRARIPIHKTMEYKNKAAIALRLRFDQEIIDPLLQKEYSIQKAMEEKPEVLKKITGQDMNRVVAFLDNLSQLAMVLDMDICRNKTVKILHKAKVVSERLKLELPVEEERERFRKFLENTEIALLLERMLEGYINEITPRWIINTKLGYGYPEAEEIINPHNEVTYKVLQDLYNAGILIRHFYDKILRCPNCNYITLSLRFSCVRCGSRNLIRDEIIEHYACAHVDLSRRFKTPDGQLICPKCTRELKQLGLDYSKPGIMYECCDCGDVTGSPYQKLLCLNCGNIIKKEEGILEDVWYFALNNEKKHLIIELLNPKRTLTSLIYNKEFNIETNKVVNGKLQGKSGVLHFYDIYAERDSDRLLIEFVTDENVVEINSVYETIAKAQDVEANVVAILAFPKASIEAKKFAKFHNVSILEGENLASIIPLFEKQLDNILKLKFKP